MPCIVVQFFPCLNKALYNRYVIPKQKSCFHFPFVASVQYNWSCLVLYNHTAPLPVIPAASECKMVARMSPNQRSFCHMRPKRNRKFVGVEAASICVVSVSL